MPRFVKAEAGLHHTVIYTDDSGKYFRFSEGTWSWRNHNPGNIVPGEISKRNGQIGAAGGFAVFPDRESGHRALLDVLTSTFGNKSIDLMVEKYAPPHENNTAAYKRYLHTKTGVIDDKKIKDFTPQEFEKLWKAIEQMEGWENGKIIEVCQIVQVRKDKSQVIYEYYIKNNTWISKEKCLEFAKQGKLDVEICKSRLGRTYLRTRAKSTIQNDLGKIIEKKSKR
jgi:hypothetical protein